MDIHDSSHRSGISTDARALLLFDANKRSVVVAYFLLILFGGFGAHRFYVKRPGTGFLQLGLTITGWMTLFAGIGAFLLAALGIWLLFDFFRLPTLVRTDNASLIERLEYQSSALSKSAPDRFAQSDCAGDDSGNSGLDRLRIPAIAVLVFICVFIAGLFFTMPDKPGTQQSVRAAASPIAEPARPPAPEPARPCKATLDHFLSLREGMSYPEASRIIGCPGTEMSRVDLAGHSTVMVGWNGEGIFGGNMNAMFQNGALISKAQFGLR
ncbi:NINE protein [Rhodoplanes sp. SY1]|uniref:NINE protein n=1 Tax=Rhodoplanes sp. SY1 TaxID=3166646 RepID=UPI0038B481A2